MKIIKMRNQLQNQKIAYVERMRHIYMERIKSLKNLWVFGYGSLIWSPDFQSDIVYNGLVKGRKRDLILYSYAYRGTKEYPGLLLGLDIGGSCTGLLYHVPDKIRDDVADMLWQREMITIAYHPELVTVYVGQKTYHALCFRANRHHMQYAKNLSFHEKVNFISKAVGTRGANIDYVTNTVISLTKHNIHDALLYRFVSRLKHVNMNM